MRLALLLAPLVGSSPSPALAAARARRRADQAAATLTVRSSDFGRVLFDGRGLALYAFTRDSRGGPSRC